MSDKELLPVPVTSMSSAVDLETWLQAQSLPKGAEHPLWKPSRGRPTKIRSIEHLAVLMAGLSRADDGFSIVEWRRPFPHRWAQTAPAGDGLIVELNDGIVASGGEFPCTRRAFKGRPGDYPLPDERDPRFKTKRCPVLHMEMFGPLEGAELIWSWVSSRPLPPGTSVTMRHFGAADRRFFGGGDL